MDYKKLIGFQIDTNQFTSSIINSKKEAEAVVKKAITIYGEDILDYMFSRGNRFTTFANGGLSLRKYLEEDVIQN
jgi:hypothetical protein